MAKNKFQQAIAAFIIAALLTTSVATLAMASTLNAPAAQDDTTSTVLRAKTVTGTAPAQNNPQIWLGLAPDSPGGVITLFADWDRFNATENGLNFYILTQEQVGRIGDRRLSNNNTAAGNPVRDGSSNQQEASFQTVGNAEYTIVVTNDSTADAIFTLTAEGGTISDGSNQVTDPTEAMTDTVTADDTTAAVDSTDAVSTTVEADDTDTTAATATTEVTTTAATTDTTAADAATTTASATTTDTTTAETTTSDVTSDEMGVVEAKELEGELPEQNDQHLFGLEPSVNNGTIKLVLRFDPQDNAELARRLNFWVFDEDGLEKYRDPQNTENPSSYAIAAGNLDKLGAANERTASFTSSGFGPYTVNVYNNSRVPGTYSLRVDGGVLVDDSNQSTTAQEAAAGGSTVSSTETVSGTTEASTDDSETATETTDDTATATTREGEPGGTYVVQGGDTLGLIARDIYGAVSYYQAICDFNGIEDCNRIEVGDVIRLPTQAEVDAGTVAPSTPEPAADTTTTDTTTADTTVAADSEVTSTVEITDTVSTTDTVDAGGAVTETATTTDTTSSSGGETADLTISEIVSSDGSGFTTLATALDATGLSAALSGSGPLTLFAPTDAAFAALPTGAVEQLLQNPLNQLDDILLFHILPGQVMSSDITDGMQATTQQGKAVNFEVNGDSIKINGANLVVKDIPASNGVIHVIDAVVLPPPD